MQPGYILLYVVARQVGIYIYIYGVKVSQTTVTFQVCPTPYVCQVDQTFQC